MITPDQFIQVLNKMKTNYRQDVRLKAKPVVGRLAKAHFDDSFKREGFTDVKFEKWAPRKDDERPEDPILHETGRLKVSNEIKYISDGVQIINSVPYGKYHNYQIGQTHKRKFIGHSQVMNKKIKDALRVIVSTSIRRSL